MKYISKAEIHNSTSQQITICKWLIMIDWSLVKASMPKSKTFPSAALRYTLWASYSIPKNLQNNGLKFQPLQENVQWFTKSILKGSLFKILSSSIIQLEPWWIRLHLVFLASADQLQCKPKWEPDPILTLEEEMSRWALLLLTYIQIRELVLHL